jgi:hypothetical protein
MDAAVLARENARRKARPAGVAATPAGTQEADRRLQDMPDILRAVRRETCGRSAETLSPDPFDPAPEDAEPARGVLAAA